MHKTLCSCPLIGYLPVRRVCLLHDARPAAKITPLWNPSRRHGRTHPRSRRSRCRMQRVGIGGVTSRRRRARDGEQAILEKCEKTG